MKPTPEQQQELLDYLQLARNESHRRGHAFCDHEYWQLDIILEAVKSHLNLEPRDPPQSTLEAQPNRPEKH